MSASSNEKSIYELINAPTQVMKQHMVEYFSGKAPNVKRWGFGHQDSSTNNLASMSDDGGIKLLTGSSADNQGFYMSFMTGTSLTGSDNGTLTTIPVRPFRAGTAQMICAFKINSLVTTMGNQFAGLTESGRGDVAGDNTAGVTTHKAYYNTYFNFRTSNSGGAQGDVQTDVERDNNWHMYKISSNITADPTQSGGGISLSIDGIMKATRTTAIGYYNETVAPLFSTQRSNTHSGGSSCNVGYCEVWNA